MSNKFNWETYEVPHRWLEEEDELPQSSESFTIRYLKQGATGAVKTWPAAEVLLEYLVQRGGLRDVRDKIPAHAHGTDDVNVSTLRSREGDILNLTNPPSRPSFHTDQSQHQFEDSHSLTDPADVDPYHIVELGGGSGFLSVGLSLALNDATNASPSRRKARLICTDNDRSTIKNMRYNITSQPSYMNINKSVRIEPMDWGQDVGGEKFLSAIKSQFKMQKKGRIVAESESTNQEGESKEVEDDPMCRLSHLIASDVHYGHTTLDPLSSVISAVKLRNPNVIVVLLLKERTPNAVSELKEQIEMKVERGLQVDEQGELPMGCTRYHRHRSSRLMLQDFSVTVRDVIHDDLDKMKMVEC